MTDRDESLDPQFDPEDVESLLARAAELQQERSNLPVHRNKVSLAEIEAAAREVGIEPRFLRQAALELSNRSGQMQESNRFLGAPARLRLEHTIEGHLSSAALERLAEEIQDELPFAGTASIVGQTLSWKADLPSSRRLLVQIRSRDGHISIRVEEDNKEVAGGLFGGLMGGIGGGGAGLSIALGKKVFLSAWMGLGLWVTLISGAYLGARTIFRHVVRSRQSEGSRLLQRLVGVVTELADPHEAEPPAPRQLPPG